jgi:hypothetical protein
MSLVDDRSQQMDEVDVPSTNVAPVDEAAEEQRGPAREVAMGSSAEQGSSMSTTSGFTASVRAMQRRCC